MATEIGSVDPTSQVPPGSPGDSTRSETFMQNIYTRVNTNRQVPNEKYVELIKELNDVNNKAEMFSKFKEAVASYTGDPADFEAQVLTPFREANPGFDEAFDVSHFRSGDGYNLTAIKENLKQSQDSLNNISSQKQLEINQTGMARDHYTAFISKFIQDLHRLLERLLN